MVDTHYPWRVDAEDSFSADSTLVLLPATIDQYHLFYAVTGVWLPDGTYFIKDFATPPDPTEMQYQMGYRYPIKFHVITQWVVCIH